MPRLDIRVIDCKALPNKDLIGIPDPYVRITVGSQSFDTSVAKDTLNPRYDEIFKFQLGDPESAQVELKVYAKGAVSDDFLGEAHVSLSGLVRGKATLSEHILQQCVSNATIRIQMMALDFGIEPPPETDTSNMSAVTGVVVGEAHKTFVRKEEPAVPTAPAAAAGPEEHPQPQQQAPAGFQQPQWDPSLQTGRTPNLVEKAAMDVGRKIEGLVGKFF